MQNMIFAHCNGYENYKCPYKQGYTMGAAKCSTKHLSKPLTFIFTCVKTGLQRLHDTSFAMRGAIKCGHQKTQKTCWRL